MKVVYSDLDGTLLNNHTYSADAASPALRLLRQHNIPLIFCTSKTRAEVEFWRDQLENVHPFIVENGGAIYIPSEYFGEPVPGASEREGYEVVEFGTPYAELVRCLREASQESGCPVLGFSDMSLADISIRTLLPVRQAQLARQREYDEPFEVLGPGTHDLLGAIERRGMRWTRGDRFYHITGSNDKGLAALFLSNLYRSRFGEIMTIGIGDGHNDAGFLGAVDLPVVIRSRFAVALKRAVPNSEVTHAPGPHGWNDAVLRLAASA